MTPRLTQVKNAGLHVSRSFNYSTSLLWPNVVRGIFEHSHDLSRRLADKSNEEVVQVKPLRDLSIDLLSIYRSIGGETCELQVE